MKPKNKEEKSHSVFDRGSYGKSMDQWVDWATDNSEQNISEVCQSEKNTYPKEHTSDDGRMFDYGKVKSDSHEGRMAKAKLHRMGKWSQSLHDRLHDGDDLPGWVQDKITTAEDRLRSAFEYMDYKLKRLADGHVSLTESIEDEIANNMMKILK
ncbi:MAG: hypothetical protein CBC29_06760 [Methylococcaceae bacterium TMED69]|nr:MAG: hypothetical protein CBC29_06760 [Methylococcaceae bacterium TMED69]|tara:strand:+ start:2268 stop:2729 length:462 start_codon:yes stop_codon:yes gene_type:complete